MGAAPDLVSIGRVAEVLGISTSTVRNLTNEGLLPSTRTEGQHRRYELAAVMDAWASLSATRRTHSSVSASIFDDAPVLERRDPLADLDEGLVWQDIAPELQLQPGSAARTVVQYVFTEMLNNAIDHSSGTTATVRAWLTGDVVAMEVTDDGIGAFQRLADGQGLPDLYAAVQQLTKGKQTTAPSRHSGEGIFFSSKAVDLFWLDANAIGWTVDNVREDQAVGVSHVTTGTRVRFELALETTRDLGALFREFSIDHEFARTKPVVKLFSIGVTFVSRSEAKRLLVDMEKFSEVILDFKGVDSVGQGFVDELFRVWPLEHPDTVLTPVNMNDAVDFMVTRGLGV